MKRSVFPPWFGWALAAALLIAPAAYAQIATGNIVGRVSDNAGNPLPGVTVSLTGGGAPRVAVSDAGGDFRFVNVDPGRYDIRAELSGFGTGAREDITVNIGQNTTVNFALQPAVAQTITVTAETPLLDVRRTGTGATVPEIELQEIPSARDPWVVLQQVPGVLVDRINVGGNESGQQSSYVGKGSSGDQATWNIDGVNVTDMAATGASPTYYDFDAFEEMQVTTGGTDPRVQTAGVNLNMVTKRGTNELRGSGRFFLTDNEWQEDPVVPEEAQSYLTAANEIEHIEDFGLEIGGPVVRDRFWLWGAYSEQNIENLVPGAGPRGLINDNTFLTTFNAKINAQILQNNSAVGSYLEGGKEKFGRNAGPTRPPETAWNQGSLDPGPIVDGATFWKIEDTHIFSPNFYLTGLYSNSSMGFFLTPVGGLDTELWLDDEGVWHDSFWHYESDRPADVYRLDGSSFFDTGALNHELRFGFGYRDTPVTSISITPGDQTWGFMFDPANNFGLAYISRNGLARYGMEYTDLYLGDTILWGNLTLQLGLRADMQSAQNFPSEVAANPVFPTVFPAAAFPGDEEELEWNSISPRIGATYSLGSARRTLLRGAYNRYADQLGSFIAFGQPFPYTQGMAWYWEDLNADRRVQPNEVLFEDGIYSWYNVDPDNPSASTSTNRMDYDMDVPTTDEIILGFEHELLPEFSVGLNFTYRIMNDMVFQLAEKEQGSGDLYTAADYVFGGNATGVLPNGQAYSVPYFKLAPGVDPPTFYFWTNRDGYERQYNGFELLVNKRLANRWMLRGNVSWNDWTQSVDDPWSENGDPTTLLRGYGCSMCDDEVVVEGSGTGSGAKGAVYINSRWSYMLTGLVQLPLGINLSAAAMGREGYPVPQYHRLNPGDGTGSKFVLISGVDAVRLDDIFNLDMRLAKEFRIMNRAGLTLSIDAFNVTDERTVMQREHRIGQTLTSPNAAANRIREIQSPRVFRFGARISF